MTPTSLSPAEARSAIDRGALLVDIRGADEHAREHISGALNLPVDRIGELRCDGRAVVFHCKSGMRTAGNADRLGAAANGAPAYVLIGGIDAWRAQGHPTVIDRRQPIEVMRQVQIVAGALILLGVLLGTFVASGFYALSGFVGAGLLLAGVTGWCGMGRMLGLMPWNRRAAV